MNIIGTHGFKLIHDGLERTYFLHVPSKYSGKDPVPLVIMFHGGGGTAKWGMEMTDWHIKAENEGFLAVFPNATPPDTSKPHHTRDNPQRWNNGADYIKYFNITADDIGFTRELITTISKNYKVDKDRIFATGFSNGGAMALSATIELSDQIAAVASVSGVLRDKYENAVMKKPTSMLFIVGTADPANPWNGGVMEPVNQPIGKMKREPLIYNTTRWAELIGCHANPENIYENDGVTITRYCRTNQGTEVLFCAIEDMGHTWPGGKAHLPAEMWGKPSDKLKATDTIWEFFKNHPAK